MTPELMPKLLNHRYRILEHLSSGGFGNTFLAVDLHLPSQRRCVVKQLHNWDDQPELAADFKAKFQQEAALLEALAPDCEQIPQLYAYFAEGPDLFLVQEWIEGITLETWVQTQGAQPVQSSLLLLRQLLPVLDYVHQRGIIHRDIKPSNIILQPSGAPVLIDFGIAKELLAPRSKTTAFALGTAGFMAPEQAVGQPCYGSDLYSLGLTAVYLMTGRSPQNLSRSPTGRLVWAEWLTEAVEPEVVDWLNRAIAFSPGDRYPSASAMLEACPMVASLDALSLGSDLPAAPPQPTPIAENATQTLPATAPPPSRAHPLGAHPLRATHSPSFQRNRQILINKVRNYWIKGVLETSLHDRALMALGFEQRLDAIQHPWSFAWETQAQSRRVLEQEAQAIDLFDQLGEGGTLLILGHPGSGKTTTLLELCRALLLRAEDDPAAPIPVVFNLSTWGESSRPRSLQRWAPLAPMKAKMKDGSPGFFQNRSPDIADWIIEALNAQYQVSKDLAQTWLTQQRLLLLLDGLDEVTVHQRASCVAAINRFVSTHGSTELVVCSRLRDYEALNETPGNRNHVAESGRLQLQAAIVIQSLTPEKIQTYLASMGEDLTAVQQALQTDSALGELAQSPLMLNIITLAYQGMTPEELPELSLEARRSHLFEHYIQRMLARRGQGTLTTQYRQHRAMAWLIWLAKQLNQRSKTILLLEQLQPDWLLSSTQVWIYRWLLLLCFVLLLVIPGYSVLTLDRLLLSTLISICAFGPIFGQAQIRTVETLKWSWAKARRNILPGALVGAIAGFAFKVPYEIILDPNHFAILDFSQDLFPWASIYRGTVFGLSTGLLFGFIRSWTGPAIRRKATLPNQGIWQSAKHGLFFAFFGFLALGAAALLLDHSVRTWGLFGMLFGWCLGGGEACIKHLLLRLMLWANGSVPWNYARFLDWGVERIFLQKVGGGYIFVHRLLLEHFAHK